MISLMESSLSAYHATLTRGFCVALLAANVIDSSLVTKRGSADTETVSPDSRSRSRSGSHTH